MGNLETNDQRQPELEPLEDKQVKDVTASLRHRGDATRAETNKDPAGKELDDAEEASLLRHGTSDMVGFDPPPAASQALGKAFAAWRREIGELRRYLRNKLASPPADDTARAHRRRAIRDLLDRIEKAREEYGKLRLGELEGLRADMRKKLSIDLTKDQDKRLDEALLKILTGHFPLRPPAGHPKLSETFEMLEKKRKESWDWLNVFMRKDSPPPGLCEHTANLILRYDAMREMYEQECREAVLPKFLEAVNQTNQNVDPSVRTTLTKEQWDDTLRQLDEVLPTPPDGPEYAKARPKLLEQRQYLDGLRTEVLRELDFQFGMLVEDLSVRDIEGFRVLIVKLVAYLHLVDEYKRAIGKAPKDDSVAKRTATLIAFALGLDGANRVLAGLRAPDISTPLSYEYARVAKLEKDYLKLLEELESRKPNLKGKIPKFSEFLRLKEAGMFGEFWETMTHLNSIDFLLFAIIVAISKDKIKASAEFMGCIVSIAAVNAAALPLEKLAMNAALKGGKAGAVARFWLTARGPAVLKFAAVIAILVGGHEFMETTSQNISDWIPHGPIRKFTEDFLHLAEVPFDLAGEARDWYFGRTPEGDNPAMEYLMDRAGLGNKFHRTPEEWNRDLKQGLTWDPGNRDIVALEQIDVPEGRDWSTSKWVARQAARFSAEKSTLENSRQMLQDGLKQNPYWDMAGLEVPDIVTFVTDPNTPMGDGFDPNVTVGERLLRAYGDRFSDDWKKENPEFFNRCVAVRDFTKKLDEKVSLLEATIEGLKRPARALDDKTQAKLNADRAKMREFQEAQLKALREYRKQWKMLVAVTAQAGDKISMFRHLGMYDHGRWTNQDYIHEGMKQEIFYRMERKDVRRILTCRKVGLPWEWSWDKGPIIECHPFNENAKKADPDAADNPNLAPPGETYPNYDNKNKKGVFMADDYRKERGFGEKGHLVPIVTDTQKEDLRTLRSDVILQQKFKKLGIDVPPNIPINAAKHLLTAKIAARNFDKERNVTRRAVVEELLEHTPPPYIYSDADKMSIVHAASMPGPFHRGKMLGVFYEREDLGAGDMAELTTYVYGDGTSKDGLYVMQIADISNHDRFDSKFCHGAPLFSEAGKLRTLQPARGKYADLVWNALQADPNAKNNMEASKAQKDLTPKKKDGGTTLFSIRPPAGKNDVPMTRKKDGTGGGSGPGAGPVPSGPDTGPAARPPDPDKKPPDAPTVKPVIPATTGPGITVPEQPKDDADHERLLGEAMEKHFTAELARRKTDRPGEFLRDETLSKGIKIGEKIYRYELYTRVITVEGKDALLYHPSPEGLLRFLTPARPGGGTITATFDDPNALRRPKTEYCMVLRMWWPGQNFGSKAITFLLEGGKIPIPGQPLPTPEAPLRMAAIDKDTFLQVQTTYMQSFEGQRLSRIIRGCTYEHREPFTKPPPTLAERRRFTDLMVRSGLVEFGSGPGENILEDVDYADMLRAELLVTYKGRTEDTRFLRALAEVLYDHKRDIRASTYDKIVADLKAKLAVR